MNSAFLFGIGAAAIGIGVATMSNQIAKKPAFGKREYELALSLARKWGAVFNVPVSTLLAIGENESAFRPGVYNTNDRAMQLGGAWGLMAMTLNTATGLVAGLRKIAAGNPTIAATLAKWNGTGQSLLNPDLNMMLAAAMLGTLTKEFKEFRYVAAAYHQGAGKVRAMLKANQSIPEKLPPFGKEYVTKALKNQAKFV